jgi:hypothetical protein
LTKRHEFFLWLALLILAALLRFAPLGGGLPYIDYIDEGHVLHPAIELLHARHFDPTRFTYPPLTSYLTIAAAKVCSPIYRLAHHRSLKADLPGEAIHTELGDNYDLIAPPEIIVLARLIVACLSIGIVILAGTIARTIAGARAGFFAMLFTAVCPALVSRGSIAIIDTAAAFFAVTAIYFSQRLFAVANTKGGAPWRDAFLAGAAAGFAFGGKYTVGVVFVAVIITIAALPRAVSSKVLLLLVAGVGLLAGIFLSVPAAVIRPAKIVGELQSQAAFYQSIHSDQNFWEVARASSEIGIPLLIAALLGLLWMVSNPETRRIAVAWLGFAAVLLGVVIWPSFHPFRNLLSLVPILCIAGAFFFERLARQLAHRPRVTLVVILLFAVSLAWPSIRFVHARVTHVDSRIQAIDWLQRNATKDAKILGLSELAILPSEWKRLPAHAVVVRWSDAAALLQEQHFDYLVTGNFDLRYLNDAARWSAYRDQWMSLVAKMPEQTSFGAIPTPVMPYLWRTDDERIVILKP